MTLRAPPEWNDDLPALTQREWLVTNGLGGYASGTLSGVATRRYHGLLVMARTPPRGRMVLVSHLDETVVDGDHHTPLSSHAFPNVTTPDGWRTVVGFALDPFPTWEHALPRGTLRRQVVMLHGRHTVVVRYTLERDEGAVTLVLRPFGVWRDFHHHTRANAQCRIEAIVRDERPGEIVMAPYENAPTVTMRAPGVFQPDAVWWHNFEHQEEARRGLDVYEDAFTPGSFVVALGAGETVDVVLSSDDVVPDDIAACVDAEAARLRALVPEAMRDSTVGALYAAVEAYRVDRADPPALIAGYPWFEDWGRDTLIAFTGCYLVPGKYAEAKRLLAAFAKYVSEGMVPNRFPDGGAGHADYNTVDAPMWFFHAARRYLQYTGDEAFVLSVLRPALRDIAEHFLRGTRYNIHVNAHGLVEAGDPTTQLTWMDAKVGDWVVTSRHGSPVEINALWHAGLKTLEALAHRAHDSDDAVRWSAEAHRTATAFRHHFWNADRAYLYDVVRAGERDASVRPNALYAVGLPGELLSVEQCRAVLRVARDELLVPLALRTLSPQDAQYRGAYRGDPWSRDGAYHQGTAWPFLFGAYTRALVETARREGAAALTEARAEVRALYAPLAAKLVECGMGHLSEVMEGDAPHQAGGCFAQAWSDAEVLRAWVEDASDGGVEDGV